MSDKSTTSDDSFADFKKYDFFLTSRVKQIPKKKEVANAKSDSPIDLGPCILDKRKKQTGQKKRKDSYKQSSTDVLGVAKLQKKIHQTLRVKKVSHIILQNMLQLI